MNQTSRTQFSFGGPISPTVKRLIIFNVAFFLCTLLVRKTTFIEGLNYNSLLVELLGLSPTRVLQDFALWQIFSYLFVHIEFFHLLFNMLALYWFGSEIEWTWGSRKFFIFYVFTGVGAGIVSALVGINTIGASGAVYGLLFAYGFMFPNRVLYIYFVLPIKAKYCVALFGLVSLFSMLNAGPDSGINHLAHLSGLVFGALWFLYEDQLPKIQQLYQDYKSNKHKRPNLKVIRFDQNDKPKPPTIH